jgi:membrane protein
MKLFDLSVDGVLSDISEALSSIDTVMNDMVNVLSQDIITQNVGTWQMVNKAVQISQTIALVIVVAYWLIGFINEITDMDWRNLSMWWYFRKIIQLILAKALIDIAPDLCIAIYNFVGWALKEYGNIGTTSSIFSSIDLQGIKEMAKDMNFVDKVFFKIDMLIPKFAIWICGIIIQVMAYARILQICLMTIISPISLASIVNGRNSGAFNFIKEYVSVVSQAVIMLLSFIIYRGVVQSIITGQITGWNSVWKIVVATVTLTFTISSSQKLAKMFLGR